MERRKLCRRVQQQGESLDDYLVSLRELTKTCNFCSEECTQKSIRDQIIEGLLDGDTVEHLLRKHNLTLATTITMCRAQEAAKQQHKDIAGHFVLAIRHPPKQPMRQKPPLANMPSSKTCPGCGSQPRQGTVPSVQADLPLLSQGWPFR